MHAPRCQRCGAPLDSAADDVLCAACLLQSALEAGDGQTSESASPRLPRDFGGYRLIGQIGRGGMGVVYRAEHLELGRTVAIKLLLAGAHASEMALLRFRREAAAVAALQHPNIIAIHDYGEVDGQPYYTMDLIDGRDLAAECAGRPLPARRAAEILSVVADAVQHAHTRDVIHRDLKPSNVLIDKSGRPHLTDFGLAKHIGPEAGVTFAGQMLGSPNYVPPEQAAASTSIHGVASDVYGLGALLYHMLTGRAPFNAATPTETLRLVLETEPAPPHVLSPGLPRDLETICLTCLAKDPARRYASAAAVADELKRFLEHRPIVARAPGWIEHAGKFCRRHRVGVAFTLVFLTTLVVVAATVLSALLRERTALARALRAEQDQTAARTQAGEFAAFMAGDLGLTMQRYGNSAMLLRIAEQTDAYYRQLPRELRDRTARMAHAAALEQLAALRIYCRGDVTRGADAMREAATLRAGLARENPDDAEAAARQVWLEWRLAWATDHARANDPTWRQGLIDRLRGIMARHPESMAPRGCLAYLLCRMGRLIAFLDPTRTREGLALVIEGNALLDSVEWEDRQSIDDENHRYATIQGCRTMLASALQAAGEEASAIEVQEQCLAHFTAAWRSDTGHLMLRELLARTALELSRLVLRTSPCRARDAELLARDHYKALVGLDPENLSYRGPFIESHAYSLPCYRRQADWRGVRSALLDWDRAYAYIRERAPDWTPDFQHAELPLWIAETSALLGDVPEARRWLAESPGRFALQVRAQPDLDENLEQARAAQGAAYITLLAGDPPERAEFVTQARAQLEAVRSRRPDDPELTRRDAIMRGLEGVLLAREGRTDEAAVLLGASVPALLLQPADLPRLNVPVLRRFIIDAWCDVLSRAGRREEAIVSAEAMLAAQEAECARDRLDASLEERLAADLVRLAGLLNPSVPAEAARRRSLLERAASLIDGARARGAWQTAEDRRVSERLSTLLAAQSGAEPSP